MLSILYYYFLLITILLSAQPLTATANPVHAKRDNKNVLTGLDQAQKNTTQTIATLDSAAAPNGGFQVALALARIVSSFRYTNDSVYTLPPFGSECPPVNSFIMNTLEPNYKAMINKLIAKKADIKRTGNLGFIVNALKAQQSPLTSFFNVLCKYCGSGAGLPCPPNRANMLADVNQGISAYST